MLVILWSRKYGMLNQVLFAVGSSHVRSKPTDEVGRRSVVSVGVQVVHSGRAQPHHMFHPSESTPIVHSRVRDHFDLNLQVYHTFLGAKHRNRSPTTPIILLCIRETLFHKPPKDWTRNQTRNHTSVLAFGCLNYCYPESR